MQRPARRRVLVAGLALALSPAAAHRAQAQTEPVPCDIVRAAPKPGGGLTFVGSHRIQGLQFTDNLGSVQGDPQAGTPDVTHDIIYRLELGYTRRDFDVLDGRHVEGTRLDASLLGFSATGEDWATGLLASWLELDWPGGSASGAGDLGVFASFRIGDWDAERKVDDSRWDADLSFLLPTGDEADGLGVGDAMVGLGASHEKAWFPFRSNRERDPVYEDLASGFVMVDSSLAYLHAFGDDRFSWVNARLGGEVAQPMGRGNPDDVQDFVSFGAALEASFEMGDDIVDGSYRREPSSRLDAVPSIRFDWRHDDGTDVEFLIAARIALDDSGLRDRASLFAGLAFSWGRDGTVAQRAPPARARSPAARAVR